MARFGSISSADEEIAAIPETVGDSGAGGAAGLVPAPAAGDAAAGKFLKADGTWDVPASGSGDVAGPVASVDNAIVRFDGTDGKVIQDYTSGAPTIGDTGAVIIPSTLQVGDNITIDDTVNLIFSTTTGSQIGTSAMQKLGFYGSSPVVQPSAYAPTNDTPTRTIDANATTLDEVADVLCTLVKDLQALGLVG